VVAQAVADDQRATLAGLVATMAPAAIAQALTPDARRLVELVAELEAVTGRMRAYGAAHGETWRQARALADALGEEGREMMAGAVSLNVTTCADLTRETVREVMLRQGRDPLPVRVEVKDQRAARAAGAYMAPPPPSAAWRDVPSSALDFITGKRIMTLTSRGATRVGHPAGTARADHAALDAGRRFTEAARLVMKCERGARATIAALSAATYVRAYVGTGEPRRRAATVRAPSFL
jgi:hypothetical protein